MGQVGAAVNRLLLTGCTKQQISYEGAPVAWYVNPSAPADNTCHVFDPAGGGVTYQSPPASLMDTGFAAMGTYGEYIFNRHMNLDFGIAGHTASTDYAVHMIAGYVNDATCLAVNRQINNVTTIPTSTDDAFDITQGFAGAFASSPGVDCDVNPIAGTDSAFACGDGYLGCFEVDFVWDGADTPTNVNILYYFNMRNPP